MCVQSYPPSQHQFTFDSYFDDLYLCNMSLIPSLHTVTSCISKLNDLYLFAPLSTFTLVHPSLTTITSSPLFQYHFPYLSCRSLMLAGMMLEDWRRQRERFLTPFSFPFSTLSCSLRVCVAQVSCSMELQGRERLS